MPFILSWEVRVMKSVGPVILCVCAWWMVGVGVGVHVLVLSHTHSLSIHLPLFIPQLWALVVVQQQHIFTFSSSFGFSDDCTAATTGFGDSDFFG